MPGKNGGRMAGLAIKNKIPVLSSCDKITSGDVPDDTELVISAHSHWMISDKILDKCKYGGIGFHPSLLPRHRGQDAVRWTVKMGDPISGGTVYDLRSTKCDAGDVILQRWIFVDKDWDYHKLWERLFPIGVEMICEAVRLIERGREVREKQDERYATWEPSWERPRLKRSELIMLETSMK